MKIAVFDFETDPFKHKRVPRPFACGFYDGEIYQEFWGDDVNEQIVEHIKSLEEPHLIYAHNGGKFDFIFLMRHLVGDIKIVNGRVLSALLGNCELRDSWGIIPKPLRSANKKDDIKYWKMEREHRERYKNEILRYMKTDCVSLFELVSAFHREFGNRLTIGGTAMKEMKKRHEFDVADGVFDDTFRQFYYGGRCQVIDPGIHHGKFIMYDINSAYAYAMAEVEHPLGTTWSEGKTITKNTFFAIVKARNYGALPFRRETGISFDKEEGEFFATIHEINAGLDTGTLEIISVEKTFDFARKGNFKEFIYHFQEEQLAAELEGRTIERGLYKDVKNSGYGKLAQDGKDFKDYILTAMDEEAPRPQPDPNREMNDEELAECWRHAGTEGDYIIWQRPSKIKTFYNVAAAASITGTTRSILLRGLAAARRPMYCDTDSIICEAFDGDIHPTRLGAWKQEKLGADKEFDYADVCAIAGKKLYALFRDGQGIKKACKGGRLAEAQILKIAGGESVTHKSDAPTFNAITGKCEFITRTFRATATKGRFGQDGASAD